MQGRIATISLLGLVLAVGCDDHHDDLDLGHFGGEFSDAAADTAHQVETHHHDVSRAGDLGAVSASESRHRRAMHDAMRRMGEARVGMGMCARAGGMMGGLHEMEMMDRASDEAGAEMARHERAMQVPRDMDAARAEEDRHRAAMRDSMGRMRAHADDMMNEAAGMPCSGMRGHTHGDADGGSPAPDPAAPVVGAACDEGVACPSAASGVPVCLTDWPGGYCAVADCAPHGHDCPGDAGRDGDIGSKCVLAPEPTCLALCEADDDCRPGYACVVRADAAGDGEVTVCMPR